MAPRRVKVNKIDYKKLSSNDVICPLCRGILIKPVTLPCSHGFCSSCFNTATQNANVVCPLCRVRIGSWLRSATKSNKLVNEDLWNAIQELFPAQIRNKLDDLPKIVEDKSTPAELNKNKSLKRVTKSKVKNEMVVTTTQKSEKSNLLTNFAKKEYTCRILCQDKESQKNLNMESHIQRKNKKIQEIAASEIDDRSNSIESECIYFKPIDHRHNPPSEGLAPIKVPTKKPSVSPHFKILAPSGQNQINMNLLESAFARLCSPVSLIDKKDEVQEPVKRKNEKNESKAKKKLKTSHIQSQSLKSKNGTLICDNLCESSINIENLNNSKNSNNKETKNLRSTNDFNAENLKKSLQEQADFELAMKLQQSFNQSAKYSTRSTVLKRLAAKNQLKMEGLITPYKVN